MARAAPSSRSRMQVTFIISTFLLVTVKTVGEWIKSAENILDMLA